MLLPMKRSLVSFSVPHILIILGKSFLIDRDLAKFEVCSHKFVDFSEYGYGISLLNDCKYGFAVKESTIHMSIVRAPKSPDANCDIGIL